MSEDEAVDEALAELEALAKRKDEVDQAIAALKSANEGLTYADVDLAEKRDRAARERLRGLGLVDPSLQRRGEEVNRAFYTSIRDFLRFNDRACRVTLGLWAGFTVGLFVQSLVGTINWSQAAACCGLASSEAAKLREVAKAAREFDRLDRTSGRVGEAADARARLFAALAALPEEV